MRVVLQRVSRASVRVEGCVVGEIGPGLLLLLGVAASDTSRDLDFIVEKVCNLRIFEDESGKMNVSIADASKNVLLVSQFTLLADCSKGRRPSFVSAMQPDSAREFYERAVDAFRFRGLNVHTGEFGAHMAVELINDGPVTIILDSKQVS